MLKLLDKENKMFQYSEKKSKKKLKMSNNNYYKQVKMSHNILKIIPCMENINI